MIEFGCIKKLRINNTFSDYKIQQMTQRRGQLILCKINLTLYPSPLKSTEARNPWKS